MTGERIIANRKNQSVTVHITATGSFVVAGNNTVSNVATGDEIISGATIRRIWWGMDTGTINVKRGSNNVLQLNQSGYMDFAGHGGPITLDVAATVAYTIPTNGFIMIELGKIHSFMSSQT
jgi:hypothetical protein